MGYDSNELHNSKDITQTVNSQHITIEDSTLRVDDLPVDADAVIRRMRQVFDAKNDVALASALKLAPSAPSNWRQRNSPPLAICMDIARTRGVSLDWLIFGVGNQWMSRPATRQVVPMGTPDEASEIAKRLSRFVFDFDATKGPDDVIWLEQHIRRTVNEYGDWLASTAVQN
jgi:hypothetical protein